MPVWKEKFTGVCGERGNTFFHSSEMNRALLFREPRFHEKLSVSCRFVKQKMEQD